MLSQNECSYINYVQNINEITYDLISSTICEIQKVQMKEKFAPGAFILASGSMIFSCSEIGSIPLTSGVFLAFTYIFQSVLNRKISFEELLNRFHYTNYPLIWNNIFKNITMSNLPFSKRPLIINDEINFNQSFKTNNDKSSNTDNDKSNNTDNDESNNTDNDKSNNNGFEYNNYDELYDGDSLREIYANKNCKKQIPKKIIKNECIHLSSDLDNYQLIVFFEQNMINNSSLLFKALSGIDCNFTNHKQMKISSDSINIDILMERFRGNNGKPYSTIKNAKIKFIYMKGYDINEINEMYNYFKIKPIFVSSLKENNNLQLIPNEVTKFYLFYLSQNFYQSIVNELYNKSHRWDYFVVNNKSFTNIVNNDQIDKLKQNLGIPFANIIPINSNSYDISGSESIAQALIKHGCLSILQSQL